VLGIYLSNYLLIYTNIINNSSNSSNSNKDMNDIHSVNRRILIQATADVACSVTDVVIKVIDLVIDESPSTFYNNNTNNNNNNNGTNSNSTSTNNNNSASSSSNFYIDSPHVVQQLLSVSLSIGLHILYSNQTNRYLSLYVYN
jgi:hypothetical protein